MYPSYIPEQKNHEFAYPGYPSYIPGVEIFSLDAKDMPLFVLGFTDGRRIAVKKGLQGMLAEFVLLHEEEHVKDMNATEKEVDRRALQRLRARHAGKKDFSEIKLLLKRRWPDIHEFLPGKNFSCRPREPERMEFRGFYWKDEGYF